MRTAIIGAGISGLAAARTLKQAGHDAVIYEALSQVGGRIASVRTGGYLFDAGATTIAPRGRELEEVMFRQISDEGLCKIDLPVFVHNSLRISAGDPAKNRIDRFCYVGGNDVLAQRLAEGLDIRLNRSVEALERDGDQFRVRDEPFDAVIVALPTPDVQLLFESLGENRPFSNAKYRSCLSVMLGYGFAIEGTGYHALVDPDGGHPLGWLSLESHKCPGRAPEGKTAVVAQLGPQFSKLYFDSTDEYIATATIEMLVRLYDEVWAKPEVVEVKRWRYSHPEMFALFDSVNRPGSKLAVAGDGLMGPRVEYAFESGVKAARLVMEAK